MTDTPKEARALREHVELHWSAQRQTALAARIVRTHRRRTFIRRGAVAVALLICAFAGVALKRRQHDARTVLLADGSAIEKIDTEAVFVVDEGNFALTDVRLERGKARFSVSKNPKRLFKVRSGDVGVEVLGTVFDVERLGTLTRVRVVEGTVRVTRGDVVASLSAGEQRELPTYSDAAPAATLPEPEPMHDPAPEPVVEPPPAGGIAPPKESLDLTLRDVDSLRLKNDFSTAAARLKKALRQSPNDPLAPQATFTMARLYQDDMSDAHSAAPLFQELRERYPKSLLAEDALAREIACRVKIGELEQARALARQYREMYKAGAHTQRIRQLVGED